MAMDDPNLPNPHWKLPIAVGLFLIDKKASMAVHWLYGKILIIDLCCVHILAVILPMPRGDPEVLGEHDWRLDLDVSSLRVLFSPEIQEDVFQDHAFWQEERKSWAFIMDGKKLEFPAQFSMITLFCLIDE